MDQTSQHLDVIAHLKGRIEHMESQLTQMLAAQARQPVPRAGEGLQAPSQEDGAIQAPVDDEQHLAETAARWVRMAHNPNFGALLQGLPDQLRQVLSELAPKAMLSHDEFREALSRLWQRTGATVPEHFEHVLAPVVRGFVGQPPAKREALVDSLTAYLTDQLVKVTQPADEHLSPQLSRMQQALSDTGLAPEAIDPHTPQGQEAMNYLMAGQLMRQTSALLRQQMQQAQAAVPEADATPAPRDKPTT